MLTFVSFIIVMLGCLNWFFIGAFQYDFVAGFFGSQASLLSRLVYFAIGMASFYIIATVIKNKGRLKITENSFKNNVIKQPQTLREREKKEYYTQIHKNQDSNENFENMSSQNRNFKKVRKLGEKENFKTSEQLDEGQNENLHYGYKDFDITQYDDE